MESPNARVYVLDEGFKLVLASPGSPDDPLNDLYESPDALPPHVERAVRALAERWDGDEKPEMASVAVDGVRVTVKPLNGLVGRHLAVFIA